MRVFSIEEFAAKRRLDQENMEKELFPEVSQAIEAHPVEGWYNDLLAEVARLYLSVFHNEGGQGQPDPSAAEFTAEVRATLDKTEEPTAASVDRISVWLSTAILNAATQAAAGTDEEFLLMEWVTMRDADVRHAHQHTGGQQRPVGEPFDVDGTEMRYPGDPSAPIELWINCRCSLAPVLASEATMTVVQARDVPTSERKKDAKEGRAMPDGSYPIDNCSDLKNAIQAIGRAKDPGPVKSHIKRRKSSLGCPEVSIPDGWAVEADEFDLDVPDDVEVGTWEGPVPWHGVLAPEGVESGDGRTFAPDSLTNRDLPLPLTWQKVSDDGHKGSVTVAKIETLERINGLMHASGTFLQIPEADEVVGLLAEFGKFGVSVDADDAEMTVDEESGGITFTKARIASASIVAIPAFAEAWVSLGTWAEDTTVTGLDELDDAEPDVCDPNSPDYDQAACEARRNTSKEAAGLESIAQGDTNQAANTNGTVRFVKTEDGPGWLTHPVDTDRLRDYWVRGEGAAKIGWGSPGDFDRCRANLAKYVKPQYLNGYCANRHYDALGFWPGRPVSGDTLPFEQHGAALSLVAGSGLVAPSAWFANPNLAEVTPLTVTEEGRVFGHLAQWGVCHIGFNGVCVDPPHSETGYAFFLTGAVTTDAGEVAVGNITMDGPHAPLRARARPAMAHYDNTCAVVADVNCGEDDHGIWVAGWVRPGTTDTRVYGLRASGGLSGDWRPVNGHPKELIAALAVNSGGFPVPRAGVEDGQQVSLVAAGFVPREASGYDQPVEPDPERIARLTEKVSASLKMRLAQAAARVEG